MGRGVTGRAALPVAALALSTVLALFPPASGGAASAASAASAARTVRISSLTGGCRIYGPSNIAVDVSLTEPTEIILDCGTGDWVLPEAATSRHLAIGTVELTRRRVLVFTPGPDAGFLVANAHVDLKNQPDQGAPLPDLGLELRTPLKPVKFLGIGDSWTAAFGYYGDGSAMSALALLPCRPGSGVLNDRCSSNGSLSWDAGNSPLAFDPTYGYSNNVSWAAQATRELVTAGADFGDYLNLAVSGAEPKDFLAGGQLDSLMTRAVAYSPDVTFMTLGGNPLLGEALFGIKGCEEDRKNGKLYDCLTRLIDDTYQVPARLSVVYRTLLDAPHNHVIVMSYMSAGATYFPFNNYTLGEWVTFARAMNDAIARGVDLAKGAVGPQKASRIVLVPPVHPPTGVKSSTGSVECRRGSTTFTADGSSVFAEIVQADLSLGSRADSFCGTGAQYKVGSEWKPAGNEVWFNSADLGTHLTRLGNRQLADAAVAQMRQDHVGGL